MHRIILRADALTICFFFCFFVFIFIFSSPSLTTTYSDKFDSSLIACLDSSFLPV